MTTEKLKQPSQFKTILGMMINPASVLKSALTNTKWYMALGVSAIAIALFFAQTGLDLYKTGQKGIEFVFFSIGIGLIYGLVIIPALAVVIWLVLKLAKSDKPLVQTVSVFCLSYSGALVYGVLGLATSLLLGWKTSVAFGVTGVLWAIGPMMVTIRELTGGKTALSVVISTAISAAVLLSWSIFGNV